MNPIEADATNLVSAPFAAQRSHATALDSTALHTGETSMEPDRRTFFKRPAVHRKPLQPDSEVYSKSAPAGHADARECISRGTNSSSRTLGLANGCIV